MRNVQVSGYVQKEIKRQENRMQFSISNYKGKDQSNKSIYQYVTVKVINPKADIKEGDYVVVNGELDIFIYNDKKYTQVVAFGDGVGVVSNSTSIAGGNPADDQIPF